MYNPTHLKYASDSNMIPATQKNQVTIDNSKDDLRDKRGRPLAEDIQFSNFSKKTRESKYRRGTNSRLCGNFTQLNMHIKSSETGNKHSNTCKVCGKVAYSKSSICGV